LCNDGTCGEYHPALKAKKTMLTCSKQQMVFTKAKWTSWHSMGVAHDRTVKQIEDEYSEYSGDPEKKFDEGVASVFYQYRDILDASYHRLLSESTNLEKLFQFAPDFFVLRTSLTIPDVAKLLEVDETSFLGLLEGARHFVNFSHSNDIASSEVKLNDHAREFLCDRNRSLGHYHNPRSHHFAICLKRYNLIFNHPWSDIQSL
jgi:hypothetical protein